MSLTKNIELQIITCITFTSSSWMTVNFKTVALTLTIAAIARVATRNVTDGTNEAHIAFCKRINDKKINRQNNSLNIHVKMYVSCYSNFIKYFFKSNCIILLLKLRFMLYM